MIGHLVCLSVTLLGVDVGWQRLPDSGVQYLIQIPPQQFESLKSGTPLESDIMPQLQGQVRGFRISVGNETLRRDTVDPPPAARTPPRVDSGLGSRYSATPADAPSAPTPPAPQPKTDAPPSGGLRPSADPLFQPLPTPREGKSATEKPQANYWPGAAPPKPQYGWPSNTNAQAAAVAEAAKTDRPTQTATAILPGPTVTSADKPPALEEPAKPWWPLSISLLALTGSLSWNAYLLWALVEARRRCRRLLGGAARTARAGHAHDEDDGEEDEPDKG